MNSELPVMYVRASDLANPSQDSMLASRTQDFADRVPLYVNPPAALQEARAALIAIAQARSTLSETGYYPDGEWCEDMTFEHWATKVATEALDVLNSASITEIIVV